MKNTLQNVLSPEMYGQLEFKRDYLKKELIVPELRFVILAAVIVVSGGVKITFGNININNNKNDD